METIQDQKDYKILVIEDNAGDFALVKEFLLSQLDSPTIYNATNFKTASEFLSGENHRFDIILLDLSLPDKNGEPLILEIIENCKDTPVIVLTGYADFKFGIKSLTLGVSDYILKDELNSLALYKSIIYSSERKKISSALAESEKKYSELFHLSPLPMYVFELESLKFLDMNEALIRHYGYTREELLGMDIKQIRPAEEIPALELALLNDSRDRRNDRPEVNTHRKKNGETIQVDIQSNFIQYKGKNAKIIIATDVTERLNYIKAIEAQNEKLTEISWIQSHVIRAPLARIMGLLPMIKDLNEPREYREKMFEYLMSSADELDELIKSITDKTRIADYREPPQ